MITDFLLALVAYLGIVFGYALILIAPEEKKPLSSFALALQHISFFCAFAATWVFAFSQRKTWVMVLTLIVVSIILFSHAKKNTWMGRHRVQLSSSALALFVVVSENNAVFLVSLSTFLFFMMLAIAHTNRKLSSLIRLIIPTIWFIVVCFLTLL